VVLRAGSNVCELGKLFTCDDDVWRSEDPGFSALLPPVQRYLVVPYSCITVSSIQSGRVSLQASLTNMDTLAH
jgi:hypothetical protein